MSAISTVQYTVTNSPLQYQYLYLLWLCNVCSVSVCDWNEPRILRQLLCAASCGLRVKTSLE